MSERICGDSFCATRLSRYNPGDRCSLHELPSKTLGSYLGRRSRREPRAYTAKDQMQGRPAVHG